MTTEIEQLNADSWIEMHRYPTLVSASQMATIMGCGWQSPLRLYYQMRGMIPWPDESIAMRHGHAVEGLIEEIYREQTGRGCYDLGDYVIVRHANYPWLFCTPDRVGLIGPVTNPDGWLDPDHIVRVIEFKCSLPYAMKDWATGVPEHVMPQLQTQMACCECEYATVVGLIGYTPYIYDVDRDDAMIAEIIEAGKTWLDRLANDEPPLADGSDDAEEVLAAVTGKATDGTVELPGEVLDWIEDSRRLADESGACIEARRCYLNRLRQLMGVNSHGVIGGKVVVTYKETARGDRRLVLKGE